MAIKKSEHSDKLNKVFNEASDADNAAVLDTIFHAPITESAIYADQAIDAAIEQFHDVMRKYPDVVKVRLDDLSTTLYFKNEEAVEKLIKKVEKELANGKTENLE